MSKLATLTRRLLPTLAKGSGKALAKSGNARFSLKDRVYLAKRLSYLITAGVSIVEALHILRDQAESKSQKRVLQKIAADVAAGQALSKSFAKFPKLFGEFGVHIIKIGESSGTLSQNLAYLADELTKSYTLRRKVIGTLVYPAFITVATLGITALLTVYIFPKIMPIFTSLHVPLPLTTRALIWLSAFLRGWGILSIFAFAALVAGFVLLRARQARVRYWCDWLLIRIPVAGNLARAYNLATFCRTLALLLKSGVRLGDAMHTVADTTKNAVYEEAYRAIAGAAIAGEPVSRGLKARKDLFPPMLSHMIAIGESTGNLTNTLEYLAELYEGEVDELAKGLSSAIEPALMVIMGLVVGLIAVSVITPIYEITQHLTPNSQ